LRGLFGLDILQGSNGKENKNRFKNR